MKLFSILQIHFSLSSVQIRRNFKICGAMPSPTSLQKSKNLTLVHQGIGVHLNQKEKRFSLSQNGQIMVNTMLSRQCKCLQNTCQQRKLSIGEAKWA